MDYVGIKKKSRSGIVVEGTEKVGERFHLQSLGLLDKDFNRPFVGVINSWDKNHRGHIHLRITGDGVKKGICQAGGIPFKFNIISIYDGIILAHNDMRYFLQNRGRSPPLECQAQMIFSLY